MLKNLTTCLTIGLLSLALTAGASAQPASRETDRTMSASTVENDRDDDGFDWGLLGLLGLLGLAGLMPRRNHDHVVRRDTAATTSRT